MDASDEAPEDNDAETNETAFEPDPSVIAFLDQESAAFAEVADEFENVYGFRHDCHCDEDYTTGKVGEVTECFAGMIVDSLATCARLNYEKQELQKMVETLIGMTRSVVEPEALGMTDPENAHTHVEFLDNPATGDNA